MEPGTVLLLVITAIIIGVLVGIYIGKTITDRVETQGAIYVHYHSADSDPSLLLDCDVPISDIAARKRASFNVHVIS